MFPEYYLAHQWNLNMSENTPDGTASKNSFNTGAKAPPLLNKSLPERNCSSVFFFSAS